MFERFTDRARRVIAIAQDSARGLGHSYIGNEHLLLGLITEGEGIAARVLESGGVTATLVRDRIVEISGTGLANVGHVPFAPSAKKALEDSLRESLSLAHKYIGTEHILLGVLHGETLKPGVATSVLNGAPCSRDELRQKTLAVMQPVEPATISVNRQAYSALLDDRTHLTRIVKWLYDNHRSMADDVFEHHGDDTGEAIIDMLAYLTDCKNVVDTVRKVVADV